MQHSAEPAVDAEDSAVRAQHGVTGQARWQRLRGELDVWLDSMGVTVVMTIAAVYALFGDDVRVAATGPDADATFAVLSTLVFVLFALEVVLLSLARPGYLLLPHCSRANCTASRWPRLLRLGSFFFWLDVLATVSLIFEVPAFVPADGVDTAVLGDGAAARAGRASRSAARAVRFIRAVRVVRLVRIIRVYRYFRHLWAGCTWDTCCARPHPACEVPCRRAGCEWGESLTLTPAAMASGRRWRCRCAGRLCWELPPTPEPEADSTPGVRFSVSVRGGGASEGGPSPRPGGADDSDSDDPLEALRQRARRREAEEAADAAPTPGPGQDMAQAAATLRRRGGAPPEPTTAPRRSTQRTFTGTSRVGEQLSDRTTQHVIIGVLLMLFIVPLLTPVELDGSQAYSAEVVHEAALARAVFGADLQGALDTALASLTLDTSGEVLRIDLNGSRVLEQSSTLSGLRSQDILKVHLTTPPGSNITVFGTQRWAVLPPGQSFTTATWFNARQASRSQALLSIGLTLLVLAVLAVGAYSFSHDLHHLVLLPLEQVIAVVQAVSANPLQEVLVGDQRHGPRSLSTQQAEGGLETALLLHTVSNIGKLLRTGFGGAGAAIATHCVNREGELDMSSPAAQVQAIFLHVRIDCLASPVGHIALPAAMRADGVTPLTYGQCVREEEGGGGRAASALALMRASSTIFVNRLASILHSVVEEHGGAVLRTGEQGFLFAWKLQGEGVPVEALGAPPPPPPSIYRPTPSSQGVEEVLASLGGDVTVVSDEDSDGSFSSEPEEGEEGDRGGHPGHAARTCAERHLLSAPAALFDAFALPPAARRTTQLPVTSLDPALSAAAAGVLNLVTPAISRASRGTAARPRAQPIMHQPSLLSHRRRCADLALLAALRALAEVQVLVQVEAAAAAGKAWAAACVPRALPWRGAAPAASAQEAHEGAGAPGRSGSPPPAVRPANLPPLVGLPPTVLAALGHSRSPHPPLRSRSTEEGEEGGVDAGGPGGDAAPPKRTPRRPRRPRLPSHPSASDGDPDGDGGQRHRRHRSSLVRQLDRQAVSEDEGGEEREQAAPPSHVDGAGPRTQAGGGSAPSPAQFMPRVTFGLHLGDALEGVLGSPRKVDSVLLGGGPDIATALPSVGDVLGLPLVMSGQFVAALTPVPRALARRVERVVLLPGGAGTAPPSPLRSTPAFQAMQSKEGARADLLGQPRAGTGHAADDAESSTPPAHALRGGQAVDVYTYDTSVAGLGQWLHEARPVLPHQAQWGAPQDPIVTRSSTRLREQRPSSRAGSLQGRGRLHSTSSGEEGQAPGPPPSPAPNALSALHAVVAAGRARDPQAAADALAASATQPLRALCSNVYGQAGYTPAVWLQDPVLVYLREGVARSNAGVHAAFGHAMLGGVAGSGATARTPAPNLARPGPTLFFRLLYALGLAYMLGEEDAQAALAHKLGAVVRVWQAVAQEAGEEQHGGAGMPPAVAALHELVRHLARLLAKWRQQDQEGDAERPGRQGTRDWARARLALQFALKVSRGLAHMPRSRALAAEDALAFSPWRPVADGAATAVHGDAPTRALLAYMARYNNVPPPRDTLRLRTIELED